LARAGKKARELESLNCVATRNYLSVGAGVFWAGSNQFIRISSCPKFQASGVHKTTLEKLRNHTKASGGRQNTNAVFYFCNLGFVFSSAGLLDSMGAAPVTPDYLIFRPG
jgi:hypothetical protein